MRFFKITTAIKYFVLFLSVIILKNDLLASNQNRTILLSENSLKEYPNKHNADSERLKHVRYLFSVYPLVKLPFSCKIQSASYVTDIYTDNKNDTLVFGEFGPFSIIGIVPDTSKYFCIFYMTHADDVIPSVVIFDKNGQRITQKFLGNSCWQGGESDCTTIVTIDVDLKMVCDYKEFLFDEDEIGEYSSYPSNASGYVEYSEIDQTGKIIITKKILKTREELFLNPIIH